MSKVEPGLNDGAAFLNNAFAGILSETGQLSVEDFAARMLEKLIADGFLEMKPGCNMEQAAGMFAAAFKTIKVKMPVPM